MSRIGRLPIPVPPKVKVAIDGRQVQVQGPKGHLSWELPPETAVALEGASLTVTRKGDSSQAKAMHGLSRALLRNMVDGVAQGFSRKLEIHGVGFKAAVDGKQVQLILGYSHPIRYPIPDQIKVVVEENTKITIEGPDKRVVGQVAADLRGFYPPEPYKGKGIRYAGERIVRKEGKTVQQ